MKQVDINAILAKYGCKKPRPEDQAAANTYNYQATGSVRASTSLDLTEQALELPEYRIYTVHQTQYSTSFSNVVKYTKQKAPVSAEYLAYFENKTVEANSHPYDEPAALQALSVIQPAVSSPSYAPIAQAEQKISMEASQNLILDVDQQIAEVRRDVNALHRTLVNMRVHCDARMDRLEQLIVLLLQRTE